MPETTDIVPETLSSLNLSARAKGHPSPNTWRDQIIYFLLPDRFSDGEEDQRPLYDRNNPQQYKTPNKRLWMDSGKNFQGGTIKGITSKLDYLKNLGVTTMWVGPIFKQRKELNTYHGYGIQNFLDVDPRFGTRQDVVELVAEAHKRSMYILLDVIYNHTGNNWFYEFDGYKEEVPYRYSPPYEFGAWRSSAGTPLQSANPTEPEDGVWPKEFQNTDWYTRCGKIEHWDKQFNWEDSLHKDVEFRRGDFFSLKDLNYDIPGVLSALISVYRYWIALTDCDGFRIDTIKHVPLEVSRNFCGAIHEYPEYIGKENFLLLGEVTGGEEMQKNYLEVFGRNIDAALDIGDPSRRLEGLVKGLISPSDFFRQYTGHDLLGSHREVGRYHISVLDDHDKVGSSKHRFAANNNIPDLYQQVAHAVGVQLTTLGIPCIYYGTEQAFDGNADQHDVNIEPRDDKGSIPFDDRYIRESMFGSCFGAFETTGCHFFDSQHPGYIRIAAIARIRNREDKIGLALRRGRQYPRETKVIGVDFVFPEAGELVAWSRILLDQEVLIVLNTHGAENRGADITIDAALHSEESTMNVLYRSDWSDSEIKKIPGDHFQTVPVKKYDGTAAVRIDLPPAGMAILA